MLDDFNNKQRIILLEVLMYFIATIMLVLGLIETIIMYFLNDITFYTSLTNNIHTIDAVYFYLLGAFLTTITPLIKVQNTVHNFTNKKGN